MVRRGLIALLGLMTLLGGGLSAQDFSLADTVTEYPHKGTFYHDRFEGRKTASGEVFDQNAFTAAHWKIKLGTYVMVTNRNTGLQVIVKINDRCPKHGVLDLSHRAATAIGIRGSQPVTLRLLPDGYEQRRQAQDALFDSVYSRLRPAPPADDEAPDLADNAAASVTDQRTYDTDEHVEERTQKPVAKAKQPAAPKKRLTSRDEECYKLILCTVPSHAEAFNMIQKLSNAYRENVTVEALEGSNELLVSIDLNLGLSQAVELHRAMRRTFPEARLKACP